MIIHYKKSMLCVILMSIPLIGMDQSDEAIRTMRTMIEKDERLQGARRMALFLLDKHEGGRPGPGRKKSIVKLLTETYLPDSAAKHVIDYEYVNYTVNIPTDIGILIDKGCISLPAGHTLFLKANGGRNLTLKVAGKRTRHDLPKQSILDMKSEPGNFVCLIYQGDKTWNTQPLLERGSTIAYGPHLDGVSLMPKSSRFFQSHSDIFKNHKLEPNDTFDLVPYPDMCLQDSLKGKEYTVALLDDRQGFVVMCDDKLLPVFPPVVTNVTSQHAKPSDAGDRKDNA